MPPRRRRTTVNHGIIPKTHAVAYQSEEGATILSGIAKGAIVPGIVASAAVGDRGDVRCKSEYLDGRWTLYIRRKLDTGHQLHKGIQTDVKFVPGGTHAFACAAFDHASKRHAYGFSTYRLVLAP